MLNETNKKMTIIENIKVTEGETIKLNGSFVNVETLEPYHITVNRKRYAKAFFKGTKNGQKIYDFIATPASSEKELNEAEFTAELNKIGASHTRHQAMSGSQYWTINGNKYRLSDHLNEYRCRAIDSHIEVWSYNEMLKKVNS